MNPSRFYVPTMLGALLLGLLLGLGSACSSPSTPSPGPGVSQLLDLDGSGGSGGTGSTSQAGTGGACPSACDLLISPRDEGSPLSTPYTGPGFDVTACASDDECEAPGVSLCRYTKCNTDCGFCMFLDPWPCSVDGCPGHNTTCQGNNECTNGPSITGPGGAPLYLTECISGRCLVLPPVESEYVCTEPGAEHYDDDEGTGGSGGGSP